jgi:pimeloyl-ACP methyl ester carboxylesterase
VHRGADVTALTSTPPLLTHHTVDVRGTRIHYVAGGAGPAAILLHGWPQTSHAWRRVAASLPDHRVIVPDLRGFGDSDKPASGYDAATMAADLHGLLEAIGLAGVIVVGHDWGAVFGYVLAASYPGDVAALGIVEMALPGTGVLEELMRPCAGGEFLWHIGFQSVPDVPELLLRGNERAYLTWFFEHHAHAPDAIAAADRDVYLAAAEQAGALRAGLAVYQAYFETAAQVAALAQRPLDIPVLAYGGDASLGELALISARAVAPDARGGVIPLCGHWAPDEQPDVVAELIRELVGMAAGASSV